MKVILIVAALLGQSFAFIRPTIRITNGENAARDQFPHQVSMQWGVAGTWQHICGGSIITQTAVLTAGHCITETPDIGSFQIVGGIINLNENVASKQTVSVARYIVHPNYEGGVNRHDVAVLKLEDSVKLSEQLINSASLHPIGFSSDDTGLTGDVVLSGWGSTSTSSVPNMPNDLQTVTIPLLTDQECKDALIAMMGSTEPYDHSANLCTGPLTGSISACSGDSGGPLIKGGRLVGIVSWGFTPCGSEGAPSVYTRVATYYDFIIAQLP